MPRYWGLSIFGWRGQSKGICDTVTITSRRFEGSVVPVHTVENLRRWEHGGRGAQTRIQAAGCAGASLRMSVSMAEAEGNRNTLHDADIGYRQGQVATAKSLLSENEGRSRSWKGEFSKLEGGLVWGWPELPSGAGQQLSERGGEGHPASHSTAGPFCRTPPQA